MKRNLFIDFDNTLVDTVQALIQLYNEEHRGKSQIPENIQYEHWNLAELFPLWDKYDIEEIFNDRYLPLYYTGFSDVYKAIRILSDKYQTYIVSCGGYPNITYKANWINETYLIPNNVNSILLTKNAEDQPDKSIIDMSNGILIDDNLHSLDTSNAKFKYVFGKEREYNKTNKYQRLETWKEVIDVLAPESPL